MKKIRILIADDHAIIRDGLSAIFRYHKEFSVVGLVEDGQQAVSTAALAHPSIVLMDLEMPTMDGVEATAEIKRADPSVKVLILTSFGTSTKVVKALANGADGAISKTITQEELIDAINSVLAGRRFVSPEIEDSLAEDADSPIALTDRQAEILESLVRGLTNKEIARQYGISTGNVKFHLAALFRRLNVSNRTEAVAIALRKHLLKAQQV